MSLRDWFAEKRNIKKLDADAVNSKLTDKELGELWIHCFSCGVNITKKEWRTNLRVCPKCNFHFRIGVSDRLEHLLADDTDWFSEIDETMTSANPLDFEDTQKYTDRKKEADKKSGLKDAIVTGVASIGGESLALAIMDFSYMGGSMGSVVGEKITRLTERALTDRLPLVLFSASGGARMQEGTFSLMQMVKTGSVLGKLHEAGLLYISILTEPTFGGVTASYGMLGDIIIAEKGSRIGFAGRRVIEQTIRQKLPADFQTANYLLKYGQVDQVIERSALRSMLIDLIRLHRVASGMEPTPLAPEKGKKQGNGSSPSGKALV